MTDSTFVVFSAVPLAVECVSLSVLGSLVLCVGIAVVRSFERVDRWIALLVFALAALLLLPMVDHAAILRTSPDSVEYAVGAKNLLVKGSYSISLGERLFPPRYPLGFPLFVLLPSLLVAGAGSLGAGVYGVALCAALSVAAAYLAGVRILSRAAGFCAAGLVLLLPLHIAGSQEILSTAPAGAFSLLVLLCAVSSREAGLARWLGAGLAGMVAAACRPLSVVFLLPALVAWRRDASRTVSGLVSLVAPSLGLALWTAWYNTAVFGSPLRSGYHFWCPVPYDYPQLLFSLGYLVDNFTALTKSGAVFIFPLALFSIAVPGLAREGRRKQLLAERAAALAAAATTVFHLVYFWPWGVYFEPCAVVLAPVAAAGVTLLAERISRHAVPRVVTAVFGLGVLAAWGGAHRSEARSIVGLERLGVLVGVAQELAESAKVTVITARNPAHVEAVARVPVLPVSRRVEYASKLLAPHRLPLSSVDGVSASDHRLQALKDAGAIEAYPETALESPQRIRDFLSQGRIVVVDERSLLPEEWEALRSQFTTQELAAGVWRLS